MNNNSSHRRVSGTGNPGDMNSINSPLDMSNRSTSTNGSARNYGPPPLSPFHSPNPQFTSFPSPSSPAAHQQQLYQMQQLQRQIQIQQFQQQQRQNMQRQQPSPMSPSNYMHQQQQQRMSSFPPPPLQQKSPVAKKPVLHSPQNSMGTSSPFSTKPKVIAPASVPLPPPPLAPAPGPSPSPKVPPAAPPAPSAPAGAKPAASKESHKRHSTLSIPPMEVTKAAAVVKKCDWIDKALWSSRQILGGQQVNGFLRSTATVQRIKKQRARQSAKSKHEKPSESDNKVENPEKEQEAEELLKNEVMNTRTAKKMKLEFEQGIQYCMVIHETIRGMLQQMDPSFPKVDPLRQRLPASSLPTVQLPVAERRPSGVNNANASVLPKVPPIQPMPPQRQAVTSSSASAGDANGSSLRRHRKKKLPPSGEPALNLPEYDERTGRRTCTKKEYLHRISELLRFRTLRKDDAVAARLSSRDLWILARVVETYPESNMPPIEFLRLSATRRDQLFKDKVTIQDVEDHDGRPAVKVHRSLVLPLPRSVSEAAEWCNQLIKKGSRVYAMYPQTTSLYTGTVVDSTTYCRDLDDIVVVEFDGDEPNESGMIPARHIPARFVTLIPRDFPGATAAPKSGANKKRSSISAVSVPPQPDPLNSVLDGIDLDADLPGLEDGFEDLDFDLL